MKYQDSVNSLLRLKPIIISIKKVLMKKSILSTRLDLTILYICTIFLISLPAIVYLKLYLLKNPHYINEYGDFNFEQLSFGYGHLLKNLFYENSYRTNIESFDIDFYLSRLPAYPLFLLTILKINVNFYFIYFVKNICSFTIVFFTIFSFIKYINKKNFHLLILLFLFYYNPYNFHVLFTLDFEDTFVSVFFPLIIFLVIQGKKKVYIISIFIFILYFLKTSLQFFCISFSFLYLFYVYFFNKANFNKLTFLPIYSIFFAVLIWGFFGLKKAYYFPIGSSLNSTNSYYLTSILNDKFNSTYPDYSVDLLLDSSINKDLVFSNEKEFYEYYNSKNKIYIKENTTAYLKGIIIKMNFILFGLNYDGLHSDNKLYQIRLTNIPNKFALLSSLVICLYFFVKNIFLKKELLKLEFFYLSMFFFYIIPHLIAWTTSKHLVPIFLLSNMYLFIKYLKINEK